MDKLPVEILINIANYLVDEEDDRRGRFSSSKRARVQPDIAIVSRGWKSAIERHIFKDLKINSTELSVFKTAFSGEHGTYRRKFLRRLDFDVVLPEYTHDAFAKLETNKDRAANDKAASLAITGLLHELSHWPENPGLSLYLTFYSPTDNERPPRRMPTHPRPFSLRYDFSYITISGLEDIRVPCVRDVATPEELRTLHPSSVVELNNVFPRLADACWVYFEPGIFLTFREQIRASLAESLRHVQLSPDTDRLCFFIHSPYGGLYRFFPPLAKSGVQEDALCTTLHRLISQSNLRALRIEAQADPSLFWSDRLGSALTWTSLENLEIELHPVNPFNQWYFGTPSAKVQSLPQPGTRGFIPPGYGSEAEDKAAVDFFLSMRERDKNSNDDYYDSDSEEDTRRLLRVMPNDEIIVPMLRAYARCLAHIPLLKAARLAIGPFWKRGKWFISYKIGQTSSDQDSDQDSEYDSEVECEDPGPEPERARFLFHVGAWRPDEELLQLFCNVGKEQYGQEPLVLFL